ncbi:MAG TPA: AAA family ATPase [Blastocatellia bacterium]|nr:AAA family ATPase [Blastocatellia bacterium]
MIEKISINAFRLFEGLELGNLSRVNLITGANNTGKTALLEAIYLALAASPEACEGFPGRFRRSMGNTIDDFLIFWDWLPARRDAARGRALEVEVFAGGSIFRIELGESYQDTYAIRFLKDGKSRGSHVAAKRQVGRVDLSEEGAPTVTVLSTHPTEPSDIAEHFNRAQLRRDGTIRLVTTLKVVEQRLSDLKYAKLGNEPLVYGQIGLDDFVPVTQMGQGFVRLLTMFSEVLGRGPIAYAPRVVLIDEIENGLYHSILPQIWKGIAELAYAENVQVFATTHSYECIQAAHYAFSSREPYDLAIHRLEWAGERIRAVSYDKLTVETSMEMNLEVR